MLFGELIVEFQLCTYNKFGIDSVGIVPIYIYFIYLRFLIILR